ncbi:MAG: sigma 54-interacting transcriptional regulator [Anaerovoracaceae bacterium]
MKKIAIVYNNMENRSAMTHIEQEIEKVFAGEITLEHYYLDQLKSGDKIVADAILLNGQQLLTTVRPYIQETRNLIVLTRSISKKHLTELLQIPKNENVLLVNDSEISTMETLYMFYELGIFHFNLIPFNEQDYAAGAYKDISYAVTPKEIQLVPKEIEHVIDIGYREIGFDTLVRIADILQISSETLSSNLIHYIQNVVEPSMNSHNNYLESYVKSLILNELLSDSGFAVLAFDMRGSLLFENHRAHKIFDNPQFSDFSGKDGKNLLFTYQDSNYLMDRISLGTGEEKLGNIILLRDEEEIREAENQLNRKIREKGIYAKYHFRDIICHTENMEQCISTAKKAALTDYTLLIHGESGTGKELFAQSIHNYSQRKSKPFLAINCAALSENLLESELFGYEPGSFTGAQKKGKMGLFEQANAGTIFLDEIGDISPGLQSKLLRVLQEKQIMRVGSDKIINVDVRVITATNKDLKKLVAEGKFREDLFYRLSVIPLEIPPLRNRKDDILPLLNFFAGSDFDRIPEKEKRLLCDYEWPGNVRELENSVICFKTLGFFPVLNHAVSDAGAVSETLTQTSTEKNGHTINTKERTQRILLDLLYSRSSSYHSTGRPEMLHYLRENGVLISDGRLRELLSEMESKGLIQIARGRRGTSITEKGIMSLDESDTSEDQNHQ